MTPKEEAQRLVSSALPFAEQLLTKYGEFFPFGRVINVDGEIGYHAAYLGDEHPASSDLIDALRQVFRQMAADDKIRASAIIYDIFTLPPERSEKQDAICIAVDHRDSYSVQVIFPYRLVDGVPEIEAPYALEGSFAIFENLE
jgi:hypothetical protein